MWRATRSGDPAVFDLLGSIHVRTATAAPFQAHIDAAVDRADMLVLEADVDLTLLESLGLVAWHGLSWKPLSLRLDPPTYRALRTKLERLGQPPSGLDLFQPWLAAELISTWERQTAGYDGKMGIDAVVRKRAEARGLPVRFLETADDQLALFSSLDEAIQIEMLEQAITSTTAVAQTDRLVAAYDRGELSSLEDSVRQTAEVYPRFTRALLDERNLGFAEGIDAMASEPGRILVVVGAAHFVGEQSVQALLRARGFEVSRYSIQDAERLLGQ
ncbi:MAG: TraB/GumN family protein [Myxococcota bacterium]